MALIFGTFDKADTAIRDAVCSIATRDDNAQISARLIVSEAALISPNATLHDLSGVVNELAKEAKDFGFLGPELRTLHLRPYFLKLTCVKSPTPPPGGYPERITLAVAVALYAAGAAPATLSGRKPQKLEAR